MNYKPELGMIGNIKLLFAERNHTNNGLFNVSASSISDLLAGANLIFANYEAVRHMVFNCTGDFMIASVRSDTFLTALANSQYREMVYVNEHWTKFLAMVQ